MIRPNTSQSVSRCAITHVARAACWLAPLGALALWAGPARAQVIEPNGISVPVTLTNGEITLQQYFDSQTEGIDATKEANAQPGVFAPQCDFSATLVLSQSGAQAGIAWYNVPASPTAAPDAVYTIVPAGTPVGQVITSADILSDQNYAKGLIGFVLMKNGARTYYSEYMRNAWCSGCTTPDYWKMALIYNSKKLPSTFYLAFEDWEGADASSWQGNDGDFNDKVFQISGITCVGGGEACDTSELGVCANGLTECQPGGQITCRAQITASAEKCDNLDNDCNGKIDDGDNLCDPGLVCDHGSCVPPCHGGEFACAVGLTCNDAGLCIDPACDGVDCPAGQVCSGGKCIGGCDGVSCPIGQECQLGQCVDPCAGVSCDTGKVCEKGICVAGCLCRPCSAGKVCQADGSCVPSACDQVTCTGGQVCSTDGKCVDPCQGAVCPGGASCTNGMCGKPIPGVTTMGSSGSSAGGSGDGTGGSLNFNGGSSSTSSSGASPSSSSGSPNDVGNHGGGASKAPGCACRTASGSSSDPAAALGALFAAALVALRRRQRADESH